MPWKQGYTVSDEIGLRDDELAWPGGNRCAVQVVIDLNVDVESVLIVDSNVVIGQRAQGDNDSTTEETVQPVSEVLATPMVQRMKGTRVPSSTATTVGQGLVDVPMTVSTDVLRVVAAASATVRHRTTGVMVPGVEGNLETDSSRLRGLT